MLYTDPVKDRASFAKDPAVVWFRDAYYLYYSKPRFNGEELTLGIGVARGADLDHWEKLTELKSETEAEGKGIGAPAAIVLNDRVHLFYQSYGQFPRDYICHAVSDDGVTFARDPSNPVFRPTGDWNVGRAIDADVVEFDGKLFLYWATRTPDCVEQMLGVATADINSDFGRDAWEQRCDASILKPELPWEKTCIEAPAAITHDGRIYLFYAGAYNCAPQQTGCAVSDDGIRFTRIFDEPLLKNGAPGAWNSSESGHPYAFVHEGRTHLFYQGSDDGGKNWRLSRCEIGFTDGVPYIIG